MDSSTKLKRQLQRDHIITNMSPYEKALIMRDKITKSKYRRVDILKLNSIIHGDSLSIAKHFDKTFKIENTYISIK